MTSTLVSAELPEDIEESTDPAKPDAFSTMMAASATQIKQTTPKSKKAITSFTGRNGLGAYLINPQTPLLLYENDCAVVVRDLYPKSTVHTLLIPRNPSKTLLHPFDAFEDAQFLEQVKQHAAELKRLVASELRQKYGKFSALEKTRRDVMDSVSDLKQPLDLPAGRNWEDEVLVGVHAGPSMNHLHIHVLSTDHVSESMRHRKHYNSFTTPFLVRLEEFPLPKDDVRRRPDRGGWLRHDLVCWRCGKNFGNRFIELKAHLNEEFEIWKRI